jgi:hypothetical protein
MEDHLSKFDIPIKTNPKDMFVEWEYIPMGIWRMFLGEYHP